jgi:hypothetical protein
LVLEARSGIEPLIKVLQTLALPLGDRATGTKSILLQNIEATLRLFRLTPEPFKCGSVMCRLGRQKFERDEPVKRRVLSLVDDAHAAATELF